MSSAPRRARQQLALKVKSNRRVAPPSLRDGATRKTSPPARCVRICRPAHTNRRPRKYLLVSPLSSSSRLDWRQSVKKRFAVRDEKSPGTGGDRGLRRVMSTSSRDTGVAPATRSYQKARGRLNSYRVALYRPAGALRFAIVARKGILRASGTTGATTSSSRSE